MVKISTRFPASVLHNGLLIQIFLVKGSDYIFYIKLFKFE
jgi:hypothetical protein